MNVLSLFDGMSCGQIALNRCGIKYDNYFASEIDKYAIKVTQANYPNTKQLGSIIELDGTKLPKIDVMFGGSPCQSFSIAGDGTGFDGKSKLFWEYVRILKEVKPTYFLLENVAMKKEWEQVITDALGVEPIEINSSVFSGQRRKRLYWTNIHNIEIVQDKQIAIGDVTCAKKIPLNITDTLLSGKIKTKQKFTTESSTLRRMVKNLVNPDEKAKCLTSSMYKGMAANGMTNIYDGDIVRPLTPLECERLQTVPDNYTNHVSNTQRYKMIGNGWTVDVIAHIFNGLKGVM